MRQRTTVMMHEHPIESRGVVYARALSLSCGVLAGKLALPPLRGRRRLRKEREGVARIERQPGTSVGSKPTSTTRVPPAETKPARRAHDLNRSRNVSSGTCSASLDRTRSGSTRVNARSQELDDIAAQPPLRCATRPGRRTVGGLPRATAAPHGRLRSRARPGRPRGSAAEHRFHARR